MSENYPKHQIDDEVEVHVGDDQRDLRGTIIGVSYVYPIYMYIVLLENPTEGEFGPQSGLNVPESLLVSKPDIEEITERTPIGSYVYAYVKTPEDGGIGAIDVKISVGSWDGLFWYVISEDELDGIQPVIYTPFTNQEDAGAFAQEYLDENHEAAPGENAEQYLARIEIEGDNG